MQDNEEPDDPAEDQTSKSKGGKRSGKLPYAAHAHHPGGSNVHRGQKAKGAHEGSAGKRVKQLFKGSS